MSELTIQLQGEFQKSAKQEMVCIRKSTKLEPYHTASLKLLVYKTANQPKLES